MTDNILDVAVVGGGISGVYSAWRLLTDGGKKSVTVYEADKHIGGRLLSVKPPDIDNMVAELGGMRILPPNIQPLINTLIWKLNDLEKNQQSDITHIDLYPFPVNASPASNNIVFTRGEQFRWSDITDDPKKHPFKKKIPYRLYETEKGLPLSEIIRNAINKINPDISKQTTPELQRKAAQNTIYKNQPLYKQGFWEVLTQELSFEAYKLEQDIGGYITTLINWNAADAIPWFLADFGPDATYSGIAQGYRQVVVNMAQLFTKAGGKIVCGQKIASFDWNPQEKSFTLKFADPQMPTVMAKALILAMPRRSLELIMEGNQCLENASELIKSVTPYPAFKIFSTYEQPWWRNIPDPNHHGILTLGRTTTDLPIRQTYYWSDNQGKPITQGKAMLMASYDDGINSDFWNGFRELSNAKQKEIRQHTENSSLTDASGESQWTDNAPQWKDYPAAQSMSDEMTRQLAMIHGTDKMEPLYVCFKDWADDPFGGGWNYWNIGVKSPDIIEQIINPDSSVPLYICGEAYSNWQGWVEGALETADMVLAKFNVQPLSVALEIITTSLPDASINSFYSTKLTAAGGTFPFDYTWEVKGLPTELTYDHTTGVIQGTPTESERFPLSVTVSQGGSTVTQTLSLQVADKR